MKKLAFFIAFIAGVSVSLAGNVDTLIVNCIIKDSDTKGNIQANINYESQPYGNKIGIRKDSVISFVMLTEEVYSINAQADGYVPKTVKIKYDDFIGAGEITEEIELVPSGIGKLMRLESLIFAQGKSVITAASHDELDQLAKNMEDNPNMRIQLEGHTDFRGDEKLNLKLSKDRVEAVKDYLIEKGIDRKRIQTEAFGGSKPISTENTREASRLNRRVEVRILSI